MSIAKSNGENLGVLVNTVKINGKIENARSCFFCINKIMIDSLAVEYFVGDSCLFCELTNIDVMEIKLAIRGKVDGTDKTTVEMHSNGRHMIVGILYCIPKLNNNMTFCS